VYFGILGSVPFKFFIWIHIKFKINIKRDLF
jgi:hypothetical protein